MQYLGAAADSLPVALLTETGRWDGSPELWLGLAWAVCGLSIGAVGLLPLLICRGAVAGMAALMAYALFGETLSLVQIAGMALTALGVALASRG